VSTTETRRNRRTGGLRISPTVALLGKRVSAGARPGRGPVGSSRSGAIAAALDPLELSGSAGGLPLVGSRLHLAVLEGGGSLVGKVDFISVGHGLDENAVAAGFIAFDFGELRAGAFFLFHARDFALGGSALDLVDRIGVVGLISDLDAIPHGRFSACPSVRHPALRQGSSSAQAHQAQDQYWLAHPFLLLRS